jgi:hypothetical protein
MTKRAARVYPERPFSTTGSMTMKNTSVGCHEETLIELKEVDSNDDKVLVFTGRMARKNDILINMPVLATIITVSCL